MTEILLHYKETSEKAAKLANDLLNDESLSEHIHPEPTTARVVFVLWFPGHWTTVWIDQPSGVVNFVDSCPNTNFTKYAAQILIQSPSFAVGGRLQIRNLSASRPLDRRVRIIVAFLLGTMPSVV
jgi:hypothetical protein